MFSPIEMALLNLLKIRNKNSEFHPESPFPKIIDVKNIDLNTELDGKPLSQVVMEPTRIYVKPVLSLIEQVEVHSLAHITGGGFYENIPRSIPKGLTARIEKNAVRIPPVFRLLQALGGLEERQMFNTFNMGVGMTLALPAAAADEALARLNAAGVTAYAVGEVVSGGEGVSLC